MEINKKRSSIIQEDVLKTKSKLNCLCIYENSGHPRWIWPIESKKPIFLEFYQASTSKQKAFSLAVRIIFFIGIQKWVFDKHPAPVEALNNHNNWAIFNGTVGPNQKKIMINDSQTISKIAIQKSALSNLLHEASILQLLKTHKNKLSFRFPQLLQRNDNKIIIEKLDNLGTVLNFTDEHAQVVSDLRELGCTKTAIQHWGHWSTISSRLDTLKQNKGDKIPAYIIDQLTKLKNGINQETLINVAMAHGDFTPWNIMKTSPNQLGIIDWELAQKDLPLAYDYFHFHIQKGILLERKNWKQIYTDLENNFTEKYCLKIFGARKTSFDLYLKLYLLNHVSYYLALYQKQANWHEQINWQISVWVDALQSLLPIENPRKDIISRLFNTNVLQRYAVLKMPDMDPTDLSENSDLDILVEQKNVKAIVNTIKSFPHIKHCKVIKKSFMASLFIILNNGKVLSIDLIWKIKRKAQVFMNAEAMISNANLNNFGVRVVSKKDTNTYNYLFNALNGNRVKAKMYDAVDSSYIATMKQNQGRNALVNKFSYYLDTLNSIVFDKGFIITFSGVDGAGKSTIIEGMRHLIEKRLRKPVTILRHRPSILPILSAYKYGKADAELRTLEKLPRTGNNKNKLSSLLRFGYYYLDFLLGQWYIYFKYIVKGHVVIYDRYYYDFILDAKRSNIELPSFLSKWGFHLLMKPKFNFFLYAPSEVILARKQELELSTIETLTKNYKSLFLAYQEKYSTRVFRSIENLKIQETLSFVTTTLIKNQH